jgi:hypothetical protein
MIKSYEFLEYSTEDISRGSVNILFRQEMQIAEDIVKTMPVKKPDNINIHCYCGYNNMQYYYTKWGVAYYRCPVCFTITAIADSNNISLYKNHHALVGYRKSDQYQIESSETRDSIWEELLDWIYFRTFRYTEKKHINIIDYGNRYTGLIKKIQDKDFVASYELRESIFTMNKYSKKKHGEIDIILYLNIMQQTLSPLEDIKKLWENLPQGGLLFIGTRIGTGLDILTLREHAKIFPYEHIFLPSLDLLCRLLEKADFQVLEASTPGLLDVLYVLQNIDKINPDNDFMHFLLSRNNKEALQDFQYFLQKNCMSSYAQIVARKI